MRTPWEIYDRLIEDIDPSVKVINAIEGSHYSEITSSENSIGRGMPFEVESLPRTMTLPEMKDKPLRDVAALIRLWLALRLLARRTSRILFPTWIGRTGNGRGDVKKNWSRTLGRHAVFYHVWRAISDDSDSQSPGGGTENLGFG